MYLPSSYDGSKRFPLWVHLHGVFWNTMDNISQKVGMIQQGIQQHRAGAAGRSDRTTTHSSSGHQYKHKRRAVNRHAARQVLLGMFAATPYSSCHDQRL